MAPKLNKMLAVWWLIAIIAVIAAHFAVDYFGIKGFAKETTEALVIASLLLVPFFLVRHTVLRPLGAIQEAARRIMAGDLSARTTATGQPELRELSETINAMVTKLDSAYRQFMEANESLERIVAERTRELTVEHGKMAAIFKNIPDGVIFVSMSGEIIEVNPMMSVIWGVPAEELKGKTVVDLPDGPVKESLIFRCDGSRGGKRCWEAFNCIHKNCPAYMSDDMRCWLISGTYCHSEIQPSVKRKLEDVCSNCDVYKDIIERYGQMTEAEINDRQYKIGSSLVLDEKNKVMGEIKTFYDVTEQKLLEKRKADFISLLTHDLKSPLTSILGYSDLFIQTAFVKLDDDEKNYIGSIKTNGARLLEMVEQYLDLTKIEAGMLVLKPEETDISALLNEAVSDIGVQAMEKNIKIDLYAHEGLPKVYVDREKISRVLANLLSNAVKYTPKGGKIDVSAEETSGRTLEVGRHNNGLPAAIEIIVEDNGYGISPKDLPHVFDRYWRSKSASGIRGTGLGLAVVKSLVDAHGGEVIVTSEQGKGSRFKVRIPLKTAPVS